MRKLLLTLAVLLSAVGFTTHAQDTPALPTEVNGTVEVAFQSKAKSDFWIGAIHYSTSAFATNDANEHIIWVIEKVGDNEYNIWNKGLSTADSKVYLGNMTGNGQDGVTALSSEAVSYQIGVYEQTDDDGNVTGSWVYLKPPSLQSGNQALNGFNGYNFSNRPRVNLASYTQTDNGSLWKMYAPDSETVLTERKADLASFCENTTTLINAFKDVDGLILANSNVDNLLTTLSQTKASVEADNSPTDEELEAAFDAAHQAKISFYKTIDPTVNVAIKALDEKYLYNHKNNEGDGTSPQPHAHANENGTGNTTIGFAALWHLENVESTDDQQNGLHIRSYYRYNSNTNSNAGKGTYGIGQAGSGFGDHGFTPSWFTLSSGESGIIFVNANGAQYLDTDASKDQSGNTYQLSTSSIWTIERVYVPKDITIVKAPAEDTPTTTTDGDTEEDNSITIVNNGKKVKLIPQFTSDVEGKLVTPGLTGVDWTSSTEATATIEGIEALGSAYAGDKYNELNGFAAGEVTPFAAGNTTITATSPMFQDPGQGENRTNPTGSVELVVEDPVFTTGTPVKIGNTEIEATDGVYNLDYSAEARTIIVPITANNYTADELTLSDGVTIVDGENGAQSINIAIAADATGEKTFTITYKAPAESGSEEGGEQGGVTTEAEEGASAPALFTLTVNIAKAPLQSFTAALNKSELTYSTEAQELTVTVTPKPEAYDLSAGTMTATIAAKAPESGSEGTDTQADETPATINLTKAEDGNTWTGTYSVAANTAAGAYTITFSYSEGEGDDATELATATADLTIKPVEYAVVFSGDGIDGTAMTTAPGTATVNVAFQQGGESATTAPDVTASLKKGDETAKTVTISSGAIELTDLTEGSYTLTIAPEDETNVALTGAELTINVTAKPVYTLTLTEGEGDDATTIGSSIEMTVGDTKTITASFKNGNDAVTAEGWTATIKAADAAEATDVLSEGKIVIPNTLAAGSYTLTIAAPTADDATYTFSTKTITVKVNPAPVAISGILITTAEADLAVEIAADATTGTVAVAGKVTPDGATIPTDAKVTFAATCETDGVSATIDEATIGEDGTFTATADITVPETLAAAATINVVATYTDAITATFAIAVTKAAAEEPAKEGTINGIEMNDATVAIADGEGSVTISGSYTVAEDGAVAPADASAPTLSASSVEGVTVTFGEVTIKDGKFSSEATIAVTDQVTLPAEVTITATYTPAEGEKVSETMTLTLTSQIEGKPGDLEVENPTKVPDGAVATVDGKTATVGFNASPAEGTATMEIALPSAAAAGTIFKASDFEISYSEDGIATATIDETGTVTITADENAAIGATTTITIKAKSNNGSNDDQTGKPEAYLADETNGTEIVDDNNESNEGNEGTADDAILTINVTIYGVEFTTAPSTATLGMDNTVKVTFETNACTKDNPEAEAELSVDGDGATVSGKVITFTQAGEYTVTAKAGDDYVTTTTITVKEAPTVTGIEAINADAAAGNATVYDLQGRRINRVNAAGIYIVNGVKTLVR